MLACVASLNDDDDDDDNGRAVAYILHLTPSPLHEPLGGIWTRAEHTGAVVFCRSINQFPEENPLPRRTPASLV